MSEVRKSYSARFKLQVVAYAEVNTNREASRRFDVSETNIRYWRKKKEEYSKSGRNSRRLREHKAAFPELEAELLQYIVEQRSGAFSVTYEIIREQALKIAAKMHINKDFFKASVGWVKKFLNRNNLCVRRRPTIAQRLPNEYENKIVAFHQYIIQKRQKFNFLFSQIGNADQTPIYWDMPRSSTITTKGAKTVSIKSTGNEKMRCTVMLCITADGNKLPPYIVMKRKTMPKEKFSKKIFVRVQEKGWMQEHLILDWIKEVWNKRPESSKKSLLVWDSFKAHLTDDVKTQLKKSNSECAVIPGGLTSIVQPLDVCVNKPFKDYFRNFYCKWMSAGNHTYTPGGKMRRPSSLQITQWIEKSWDAVKIDTITHSFKKCGISNSMDGSEDDELWNNANNANDEVLEEDECGDTSDTDSDSDKEN